MEAAIAAVVVALITGPLMWMLHRFDKRNSEQHGQNMKVISGIKEAVTDVRSDMKDVKADLRTIKSEHRHLATKVDRVSQDLQQHVGGG